jgi:RHS repeat-associated protein
LYDGLGNAYQYNAESLIKSGAGANYVYTAEGQRVEKSGATAVDTIYFGGRPIARLSGGAWTDLIYGPGGLLAEVPGTQTGAPVYRMTDHLGSLVGTLSSTGSVLSTQDIAPFGEVFSGSSTDPFVFTGKERDAESGNDYFGARYYSSNMGRFMSPDSGADATLGVPVPFADLENPQSLNLYGYVHNNPLRFTDPDGHATWADCGDGSRSQCLFGDYNGEANQQNGRTVYWNAANGNWDNNDPTKMNDGRVNDLSGGQLLMAVPLGKLVGPLVGSAMSKASEALTNALGRTGEAAAETGAKTLLSGSKQAIKARISL